MNTDDLIWYSLNKDDLSEVAFGLSRPKGKDFLSPHAAFTANGNITAGYFVKGNDPHGKNISPDILIIREMASFETFSWLRTFSPDSFPLSQFSRVVSMDDWDSFQNHSRSNRSVRADRWSCVVLGESLAQGGNESEIASIPISRASACFSTAIARSRSLYNSDEITRLCTERLRQAEVDRRFVRRHVAVDDLVPIWSLLSTDLDDSTDPSSVVDFAMAAAMKFQSMLESSVEDPFRFMKEFPALLDDSVEGRVLAFNRLVNAVSEKVRTTGRASLSMSAVLAAGAFLVGRGTSHSFLLKRVSTLAPSSFTWFGLMAALIGPRGWDAQWARVVKGFERQIKGRFSWNEPPAGDICWAEYFWLARNVNAGNAFNDIARMVAKTLTIEVIPGVTCQLRVLGDEPPTVADKQPKQNLEPSNSELEMRSLLEQFVILSNRSKHLLSPGSASGNKPYRSPEQGGLGFDASADPGSKPKPKSRAKRSIKK